MAGALGAEKPKTISLRPKCQSQEFNPEVEVSKMSITEARSVLKNYLPIYTSLTNQISLWSNFRNQLNLKFEEWERRYAQVEATQTGLMGIPGGQFQLFLNHLQDHKGTFRENIKGPVGKYLRIHEGWFPIVEYILRPWIFCFIVSNYLDFNILSKLVDTFFGKDLAKIHQEEAFNIPSIVVLRVKGSVSYKRSRSSHGSQILSLMDVIEVIDKDPTVTEFLLQYVQAQNILLFKTQHDAFPALSERKGVPSGCTMAYTLDFYAVHPYPRFKTVKLEKSDVVGDSEIFGSIPHSLGPIRPLTIFAHNLRKFKKELIKFEKLLRHMKDFQLDLLQYTLLLKKRLR